MHPLKPRRRFLKAFAASLTAFPFFGVSTAWANSPMTNRDHVLSVLIDTLRRFKNPVCGNVADALETQARAGNVFDLHLRQASLDELDAKKIAAALTAVHQNPVVRLRSFSVSYNPQIGKDGAVALLLALPKPVEELGMVGCDLDDQTGPDLIRFIEQTPSLKMVCVEGNPFSQKMKERIRNLKTQKTDCTIIV